MAFRKTSIALTRPVHSDELAQELAVKLAALHKKQEQLAEELEEGLAEELEEELGTDEEDEE
jgi:hypothetical protein